MLVSYRYKLARNLLRNILDDFRILSGDKVGTSMAPWQAVAQTTSNKLRNLADQIDGAIEGDVVDGPAVFPSPDDLETL